MSVDSAIDEWEERNGWQRGRRGRGKKIKKGCMKVIREWKEGLWKPGHENETQGLRKMGGTRVTRTQSGRTYYNVLRQSDSVQHTVPHAVHVFHEERLWV